MERQEEHTFLMMNSWQYDTQFEQALINNDEWADRLPYGGLTRFVERRAAPTNVKYGNNAYLSMICGSGRSIF